MPLNPVCAHREGAKSPRLRNPFRYAPLLPWAALLQVTLVAGAASAAKPTWTLPHQLVLGQPSLTLSADGRQLAFFGQLPGGANGPATLQIWDTQTKKRLLSQMHWDAGVIGGTKFLAFLPKEKGVIAAVPRRTDNAAWDFRLDVAITNLPVGGARVKYSLPSGRGEVGVFSPDGKTVAITCGPGTSFALHDVETGKELRVFRGDELPAPANEYTKEQKEALQTNLTRTLAFSPDGKFVAVGTNRGWVSVWHLGQGVRLWRKQYKNYASAIRALAFSPDSKMLASANDTLAVWRVSDGQPWSEGKAPAERVLFLPNQKLLVVDSRTRHGFMVWDLATGKHLHEHWRLPGRTHTENAVEDWALSADGSTLAIWRLVDKGIELWNVKDLIPR